MKERLIIGMIIAVIALIISLLSCTKSTSRCKACQIICPTVTFDTTYCNGVKTYKDANGNNCAMFCE